MTFSQPKAFINIQSLLSLVATSGFRLDAAIFFLHAKAPIIKETAPSNVLNF
jgi:hypothetical protein